MCTAYLMRMCSVNFCESAVTSLVADGMVVISQLQGFQASLIVESFLSVC